MEVRTVEEAIGGNVRRIRQERGLSQDELASMARRLGLAWRPVTVTHLEAGQKSLSATELLLLPVILRRPLEELIEVPDGLIRATDSSRIPHHYLARFFRKPGVYMIAEELFSEEPQGLDETEVLVEPEIEPSVRRAIKKAGLKDNLLAYVMVNAATKGEAERKAARQLGLKPAEVAAFALKAFRRSLTQERNRRVAKTQAKGKDRRAIRGHLTRSLLKELRTAIKESTPASPSSFVPDYPREDLGQELHRLGRKLASVSLDDYNKNPQVREKAVSALAEWLELEWRVVADELDRLSGMPLPEAPDE